MNASRPSLIVLTLLPCFSSQSRYAMTMGRVMAWTAGSLCELSNSMAATSHARTVFGASLRSRFQCSIRASSVTALALDGSGSALVGAADLRAPSAAIRRSVSTSARSACSSDALRAAAAASRRSLVLRLKVTSRLPLSA